MGTKRPLDFIPEPVAAWRTTLPLVTCAAAGLLAWGSLYLPNSTHAADGAEKELATAPGLANDSVGGAGGEPRSGGEPPSGGGSPVHEDVAASDVAASDVAASDVAVSDVAASDVAASDVPMLPAGEGSTLAASAGPMPDRRTHGEIRRAERAAATLRAAVRGGRVVATEGAFAWIDASERTWEGALAACQDANIDGVQHWALASREELHRLARAGELPEGAYWTRSRSARDPDAAYAYDTRRRRAVVWLKQEPNGGVVCTIPRLP